MRIMRSGPVTRHWRSRRLLARIVKNLTSVTGSILPCASGFNSGPVVVGAIGDDLRMDYTAQGDASNLAARMESSAEPGCILASDHTYRLAKVFFEFARREPIRVKGKKDLQTVFEVIREGRAETRMEASIIRGLTRFVGRRKELELLLQAYLKARDGSGQVVGIVGEAGVGKSRLLLEFTRLAARRGIHCFDRAMPAVWPEHALSAPAGYPAGVFWIERCP